jgi:hypothetical protein
MSEKTEEGSENDAEIVGVASQGVINQISLLSGPNGAAVR